MSSTSPVLESRNQIIPIINNTRIEIKTELLLDITSVYPASSIFCANSCSDNLCLSHCAESVPSFQST